MSQPGRASRAAVWRPDRGIAKDVTEPYRRLESLSSDVALREVQKARNGRSRPRPSDPKDVTARPLAWFDWSRMSRTGADSGQTETQHVLVEPSGVRGSHPFNRRVGDHQDTAAEAGPTLRGCRSLGSLDIIGHDIQTHGVHSNHPAVAGTVPTFYPSPMNSLRPVQTTT